MRKTLTICFLFITGFLFAQNTHQIQSVAGNNFSHFTPVTTFKTQEVIKANAENADNPELGMLFPNAPCDSCYEDLSKRTLKSKYFVKAGTDGEEMFLQKSYSPMHYKDASGNLLTTNANLAPLGKGKFGAMHQKYQVGIDADKGSTSFGLSGEKLNFNKELTLVGVKADGQETVIAKANWDDYKAGDDGMKVFNIFPGVNLELAISVGKLKTSFIIPKKLTWIDDYKKLLIKDAANVDSKKINIENTDDPNRPVLITDAAGATMYYFTAALVMYKGPKAIEEHDSIDYVMHSSAAEYKYQNNSLDLIVDHKLLSVPESYYPVVLDPLLVASDTLQMLHKGSAYDTTCTFPHKGCQYNLTINVPPEVQVTGVILNSLDYTAHSSFSGPRCAMNDGGMQISIGGKCAVAIQCNSPSAGRCYSIANQYYTGHFQGCIPAPQCKGYPLTFGLDIFRCKYNVGGGCNIDCIEGNNPWIMTVQGHTVEMKGVYSDQTICEGDSAQLLASGRYGVPNYDYKWMPGSITGNRIFVKPDSTTTYTVGVKDKCGNTDSGQVTITVNPKPDAKASSNSPICIGDVLKLTASGGDSYSWIGPNNFSSNKQNVDISNVDSTVPGIYIVKVTDKNGCSNQDTIKVELSPFLPAPNISCMILKNENKAYYVWDKIPGAIGYEISLNGGSSWTQPNGGNGLFDAESADQKSIMVRALDNSRPCKYGIIGKSSKCAEIIVPNVFTPNGDGKNDYFKIPFLNSFNGAELTVFDRWGRKVYESDNYKNDWDGDKLSDGEYFYVLKINFSDKKEIVYKGHVAILNN